MAGIRSLHPVDTSAYSDPPSSAHDDRTKHSGEKCNPDFAPMRILHEGGRLNHEPANNLGPGAAYRQDIDVKVNFTFPTNFAPLPNEQALALHGLTEELKQLLSSSDLPLPVADDLTLLSNILAEVEAWLDDQGLQMTCSAQIALAHVCGAPSTYVDWSKKPINIGIQFYLYLMRRALESTLFAQIVKDKLRSAIHETEGWLTAQTPDIPDSAVDQRLGILHDIADYYIAYCSVMDAIKHIKSSSQIQQPWRTIAKRRALDATTILAEDPNRDPSQGIQAYIELLAYLKGVERSPTLFILGLSLKRRFLLFRDARDMCLTVERIQEAIDLCPASDSEREHYMTQLEQIHELRKKVLDNNNKIHVTSGQALDVMFELARIPSTVITLPPLGTLVTTLAELLGWGDATSLIAQDQILFCNVQGEVQAWIQGKQSPMSWKAQVALAHSTAEGFDAMKYIDWSKTPAEISIMMYLNLLRRTCNSGLFVNEPRETLDATICEAERRLASEDSTVTSSDRAEWLAQLQTMGDHSIAYYSVVDVIHHIRASLTHVEHTHPTLNILQRARVAADLSISTQPDDLNRVVQTLTEYLSFKESFSKISIFAVLGPVLVNRFMHFGEKEDIDAAIRHLELTLKFSSRNQHASLLYNSAVAYFARFERFGDVSDANAAILRFEAAVRLNPEGSRAYLSGLKGLAVLYGTRFNRLGHIKDINKAVELSQTAMKHLPSGGGDRAAGLAQLGHGFLARFDTLGSVDDVDSAIQWLQEAHKQLPSESTIMDDLGRASLFRFETRGAIEDIESSIGYLQQAVNLNPTGPARINLARALVRRFERFGRIEDLDLAIDMGQKALDTTPPHKTALYRTCLTTLGNLFNVRAESLKQASDLNQAIKYHQALNVLAPDAIQRTSATMNLGSTFARRYQLHQELSDLNHAIRLLQTAKDLQHPDSRERCSTIHNLGQSLEWRFQRLGEMQDLELAIELQLEAAKLRPADPKIHIILTKFLMTRYERLQEPDDLELAIEHAQLAVAETPDDHRDRSSHLWSLGDALAHRFLHKHDPIDHASAISAWKAATSSVYGAPTWRLRAAWCWAGLEHSYDNLESAAEGYIEAIRLLPLVTWIGLGAAEQLTRLVNDERIHSLACDAAACMFFLAESKIKQQQHYLGQAVELLDQGRSLLWSQNSQLLQDMTTLRKVDPALATELDQVGQELRESCFDESILSAAMGRRYRQSAQRWADLVVRARKLPNFQSFLLPPPISELRKAAKDGPIIIVNASVHRFDALIIPCTGDLTLVPLSGESVSVETVKAIADQARQAGFEREHELRAGKLATMKKDPLEKLLHESWVFLGEPITRELRRIGFLGPSTHRVWWCLTGPLNVVPIHAAHPPPAKTGEPQFGMLDHVISSYTPTVSALLRSQRCRSDASSRIQLLAIGQSTDLPMVKDELTTIKDLVPQDQLAILEDQDATTTSVSRTLPNYNWTHFACHGIHNNAEPMNSGLKLFDRLLTLSKLAQISHPSADFAFLSCCHSARGHELPSLSNESLHIAGGMLFVGFRSVIGTLWAVGDREAQTVAKLVYEGFFKGPTVHPDSTEAARMVNHAALYLRDVAKVRPTYWAPYVHFGR